MKRGGLEMKIVLVLLLGTAVALTVAWNASGQKATVAKRIGVIVVDVQGDFTEWKKGFLAVSGTDKAFIEKVRNGTNQLKRADFVLFATQDWHPGNHISFYTNHPDKKPFEVMEIEGRDQVLWPPHCVQGTENARVLVDETSSWPSSRRGGIKGSIATQAFRTTVVKTRRWTPS